MEPPRKSELTPKTIKARVIRYAIIKLPQWFSELTHSSSEASIYLIALYICRQNIRVKLYLYLSYDLWN